MKRKISLISTFVIILFLQQAQSQILTNGGFESWITGPSGYLDPSGWQTSNDASGQASVLQGPPRTGSHSVSLISIPDGFGGYSGGEVYFTFSGTSYIKPLSLSGYWKGTFNATSLDGISISMYVTDTSGNGPSPVIISTPPSSVLPNWTYFSDTVVYSNSYPVSNVSIAIILSTDSSIASGQIDDLTMSYLVGVDEIIEAHFPSAVLRPDAGGINHILFVDLLAPASFRMNIFNIDGKQVYSRDFNLHGGHHQFSVPTENLPAGIYLCNITGDDMQQTIKFVK